MGGCGVDRPIAQVGLRAAVLVEGESDRLALERLALRRGRDLPADGVVIVPMGGAKSITRFLREYGPDGRDLHLAGLYDDREERDFRRGLERTGFGPGRTRADLEALGFFACVDDLEDELIRAVGTEVVEAIVEAQGELRSLRTLQKQPAQQGRPVARQLQRFMGSISGRKAKYAPLLIDALDLDRVPRPLDAVLAQV
jgi:hypothetical protein